MRTCKSSLFPAIVLVAGLLLTGIAGCESAGQNRPNELPEKFSKKTVAVSIGFGNRRAAKQFTVPYSDESTVLSILDRAQSNGDLSIDYRGSGESAFVTSIDGIENQGADGDNWVYRVNGKLADRSCGIFAIKPGDEIAWTLGPYPPDDQ